MVKRCLVCSTKAEYKIKDTSDYYCKECAEENFADLSLLLTVEEEARRLKEFLKEKIDDLQMDVTSLERDIKKENSHEEIINPRND